MTQPVLLAPLCVATALSFFSVASPIVAEDTIRASVVKLHVTHRKPDYSRPWTKKTATKSSGSGAIIANKRILTNWHVIEYASEILVQFDQSSDKYPARLIGGSPGMDLALLEMEDEEDIGDRPELPLADGLPELRSNVNAYGYPLGGKAMSVTEGIVSRIDYTRYNVDALGVRLQVDAALNKGNSGGPAVSDGKLVGLVFSRYDTADNIGYLIPAEEIQMFLDDLADGEYAGKPTIFDSFQSAENKSLRARLKLDKATTGMVVRKPFQNSANYPLKQWDVVTHVGSNKVDNLGNVEIHQELRLDFRYLIPKLAKDDKIELTILRDGKEQVVQVPVLRSRPTLFATLRGGKPSYFILGPMCFTTVTREFAGMIGSGGVKLRAYLGALNNPILYRAQDEPAFEGEELVVLSTRMFSHRMIKGYRNSPFAAISHINSEEVKNLTHLVKLLREADGEFLVIEFFGEEEALVFDRQKLIDSTESILEDEGIRYQHSKDLSAAWQE